MNGNERQIGSHSGKEHEELRRRAEKLARSVLDEAAERKSGDAVDYIIFSMNSDTYALKACYISEVIEPDEMVAVPCTPDFLRGVISVRGTIRAVYDLCVFWNRGEISGSGQKPVLFLKDGDKEFGIIVDEVLRVVSLTSREHRPLAESKDLSVRFTRGVTANGTVLLRGSKLLHEESFVVDEVVGNI